MPTVVVLPEPCSPAMRITAGGVDRKLEARGFTAHHGSQLAMHDPDERLARREAADDLLAERLLLHARDEILHHRQRDVGLEQRHAHLAQTLGDVGFGEPRFAAELLDDAREALGEVVEHRIRAVVAGRRSGIMPR